MSRDFFFFFLGQLFVNYYLLFFKHERFFINFNAIMILFEIISTGAVALALCMNISCEAPKLQRVFL